MALVRKTILKNRPEVAGYLLLAEADKEDDVEPIAVENTTCLNSAVERWRTLSVEAKLRNGAEPYANFLLTMVPLYEDEFDSDILEQQNTYTGRKSSTLPTLAIVYGSIVDDAEILGLDGEFTVTRLSRPMSAAQLRLWRGRWGFSQKQAAELFRIPVKTLQELEQRDNFNSALWGPISTICASLTLPDTPGLR